MSTGVSDHDIEREIQTLKNLRRRSVSTPGPGALPVDPDLPPPSPAPTSPTLTSNDDVTLATPDGLDDGSLFWVPAHLHPELAPGEFRAFLKSHTHPDPENADGAAPGDVAGLERSPSWLARRNSRRSSFSPAGGMADGGLGRKKSMLSRQYHPRAGDRVGEEDNLPSGAERSALGRTGSSSSNRGSIYGGRAGEKGLTLQDLQKLDEMMEEAEGIEDPTKMRQLLRRSLSLNRAPGFLQDDIPAGEEEADSPLVVPRPGSIIRRSARTKIRKPHLQGDGNGHRFAASRRLGRMAPASDESVDTLRKSSDGSADSHDDRFADAPQHFEHRRSSDGDGSTEDGVAFDAYRQSRTSSISSESAEASRSSSPEESIEEMKISLPSLQTSGLPAANEWFPDSQKTPTQEDYKDPMADYRRTSPTAERRYPSQSGSSLQVPPGSSRNTSSTGAAPPTDGPLRRPSAGESELPPGMAPPAQRSAVPPGLALQHQRSAEKLGPSPIDPRPPLARTVSAASTSTTASQSTKPAEKEKEKKLGLFSKKDKKDKDKDSKDKDLKKKEKEGFLGGLFKSKKPVEEVSTVANFSTAGPAAAAALLGSSKSAKSVANTPGGATPTSPSFSPFARYPIHVERAVYRLSHIKLANARRPLYEQVLISNLMFWYLGVIGRNVAEEKKANGEEKKEEPVKPVAKGTPPKAADQGSAASMSPSKSAEQLAPVPAPRSQGPSPPPLSQPVSMPPSSNSAPPAPVLPPQPAAREKKTSMTKPERARTSNNAEAGIRPPSYSMQGREVDHEMRHAQAQNLKAQAAAARSSVQLVAGQGSPSPTPQFNRDPYGQPGPDERAGLAGGQPPQMPRSASNPGMQPARYGPSAGMPGRPGPEMYSERGPAPPAPLGVQGPPRGVPQSSFGPPPPPQAHSPQQQPQLGGGLPSGLAPYDPRDGRPRGQSNPPRSPYPGGPGGPGGGGGMGSPVPGGPAAPARRIVTDGRIDHPSRSGSLSPPGAHGGGSNVGGVQPGQIFQYPGGTQPGQIFQRPGPPAGLAPGQVMPPGQGPGSGGMYHPSQPYPGAPGGSRPLPPPGSPGLGHPGGHNPRPEFGSPRPMGALPPGGLVQPPTRGHPSPYGPPQGGGGYPHQAAPGQQQATTTPPMGQPRGGPLPPGMQPGQAYPYGSGPVQPGGHSDYRRPQPVPGQYAPHHR